MDNVENNVVVEETTKKEKKTKISEKEAHMLSLLTTDGNSVDHFVTDKINKTDAMVTLRNMEKKGLCKRVKNDKSVKGFTYFKS